MCMMHSVLPALCAWEPWLQPKVAKGTVQVGITSVRSARQASEQITDMQHVQVVCIWLSVQVEINKADCDS